MALPVQHHTCLRYCTVARRLPQLPHHHSLLLPSSPPHILDAPLQTTTTHPTQSPDHSMPLSTWPTLLTLRTPGPTREQWHAWSSEGPRGGPFAQIEGATPMRHRCSSPNLPHSERSRSWQPSSTLRPTRRTSRWLTSTRTKGNTYQQRTGAPQHAERSTYWRTLRRSHTYIHICRLPYARFRFVYIEML